MLGSWATMAAHATEAIRHRSQSMCWAYPEVYASNMSYNLSIAIDGPPQDDANSHQGGFRFTVTSGVWCSKTPPTLNHSKTDGRTSFQEPISGCGISHGLHPMNQSTRWNSLSTVMLSMAMGNRAVMLGTVLVRPLPTKMLHKRPSNQCSTETLRS